MKWNIKNKTSKNTPLDIETVIQTLLKSRGITSKKDKQLFLQPTISFLDKQFFDSKQTSQAIKRIKTAIGKNEQIIVYTDYDVDGITGGAILWETLKSLGADVMPYVPDRFTEGYGMSEAGIDNMLASFPNTKLIITVDQGITKTKETEYAKQKGIDVIITDHHTKPETLPSAHSIVHTTELSGSGVAYIFSRLVAKHIDPKLVEALPQDHIGLASMGTIADLVPLKGANRIIAKFGLEELNNTKRVGIIALFETGGIDNKEVGTYEVGFVLGPRINAAGRLDHGLEALRLLCTKSRARARDLARKLDLLNKQRQEATYTAFDDAVAKIQDDVPSLIFVGSSDYHEGIIGLVAGQLVERFYRPAIVLSYKEETAKASARSIKGINIIEIIRSVQDDLLDFGGHPLAAGFSVNHDKVDSVKEKLKKVMAAQLTDELFERELTVDMELPIGFLTQDFWNALQSLKPFGVGNARPVFSSRNMKVGSRTTVGKEGAHLKLTLDNNLVAMGFGKGDIIDDIADNATVDIAYTIDLNCWNGAESIQLLIKDIQVHKK